MGVSYLGNLKIQEALLHLLKEREGFMRKDAEHGIPRYE